MVFDLIDRYDIDCEARRAGTLHCAVGSKGAEALSERARQWLSRGADVELLDAERTANLVGSRAYPAALLDRRAGTIQPLSYVRGLACAAARLGAIIHTCSPGVSYADLGAAWKVETPQGSVTASTVIVATDTQAIHVWPEVKSEQIMFPYFNLATEPLSPDLLATILPGGQGAWDTRKVLSSFRLDAAGRLIIGSVGSLAGLGHPIHREWARRTLQRIFPQLGSTSFSYGWWGMIGTTADALPRFHRLGRDVYSVSGYNGRGIAPATTFGRDLARIALGEIMPDDLALPTTLVEEARLRQARSALYEIGAGSFFTFLMLVFEILPEELGL